MNQQLRDPLFLLHALGARVAQADGTTAARITLVNGLQRLLPFDQAVLWVDGPQPACISAIDTPDRHAPHVQQLARLYRTKLGAARDALFLGPEDLAGVDAYARQHGLFLPSPVAGGGLLITRPEHEFLRSHAVMLDFAQRLTLPEIAPAARGRRGRRPGTRWFALAVLCAAGLAWGSTRITVPQTLLAPAEVVSADVFHLKAPFDGTVDSVRVLPGDVVDPETTVVQLDVSRIEAQLEIARAEARKITVEYEQEAMRSFGSEAARARAADARGRLEEKTAQIDFLTEQMARHALAAGHGGIVVLPDVEALRGRPVRGGEPLLRIADPHALEIDLWVPLQAALPLAPGAAVTLFLSARPLTPYRGALVYATTEAQRRDDGTMAYRARARFAEDAVTGLLGQQGRALISVGETTLFMRLMRRPIIWFRQSTGL